MEYKEFPVRLHKRTGKVMWPDIEKLEEKGQRLGSQVMPGGAPSLLTKCPESRLGEVMEWLDECCSIERYRLFGCFGFNKRQYRIDREFIGITLYFVSYTDAVAFKLRWAEFWEC